MSEKLKFDRRRFWLRSGHPRCRPASRRSGNATSGKMTATGAIDSMPSASQ